ncbi:MAG: DEAD/DEAH box helicase family protein [Lachnospiraceae bacterium]|nr:DEAD/DEAH box helicase family protein [Lachnospiraceae bacterium]
MTSYNQITLFDQLNTVVQESGTESIPDGFVRCLNQKGYVDMEYIASITGSDIGTVIGKLKGSVYQNPGTWEERMEAGWETAEEYLSGNIREKLRKAREANERYHGYFADNVRALERVLPPSVSAGDIYVTLGSPWVPADVIEQFIYHIMDDRYREFSKMERSILHDEETGTWEFSWFFKKYLSFGYEFNAKYGTGRRKASDIILRTLNMQSVAVMDTIESELTKSGKQQVLNRNETILAMEKQALLISEFRKWIWSDAERTKRLVEIYEERYASVRCRHFDGSFLDLPGIDPFITLYPYQKNAVARILFSPNTLLAHDVGSGKTYIMIAAGMELRRLKLSSKNMYVVPNNIVGQWKQFFGELYPQAFIRCIEPKDFTIAKREKVLQDIKEQDYDAIVIAYSCFSQIPVSKNFRMQELHRKRKELEKMRSDRNKSTRKLQSRIEKIREQAYELTDEPEQEGICFDQLGITRLFVDEAHNFKNVPIETKIEHVMGINRTGSAKCRDMMDKVRIVQRQNDGKGVVFATGTPITNSITDAFILQQYLQSGELAILELQSFDSWVGMFAEKSTNFEIDVDTSQYRMATRFAQFHNIPELTTMLAAVADFHQTDETQGVPDHDGYQDRVVRRTVDFKEYLDKISERADDVRNGRVRRTEDNMLKITTDGRKAALDMRLVDSTKRFRVESKVFLCADNVARIYRNTEEKRSTQLVFCDTSTPKEGFNIYDELKFLLIKMGVRADEIVYIHDATTESKREKIFENVRRGIVRVLIGSTFKLGLGVNVQDKLIALHHLDVPWRPADMVQREGRILRQGNENDKVEIFRYITEGSFDAYSWQLLETKQRFITDILSGTAGERSGADIDDTVLNYAEVKALAIGSPLIRQRVETANELSRFMILHQKMLIQHQLFEKELEEIPKQIDKISGLIPPTKEDADYYTNNKRVYSLEERQQIGQKVYLASHPKEPTGEERVIVEFQGFQIVVPERVSDMHSVIYIRRAGNYMVEMGMSEIGGMSRIDRCLHDLTKRYQDLVRKKTDLEARQAFMKRELLKQDNYAEDIKRCRTRLAELDEKLGVRKDA